MATQPVQAVKVFICYAHEDDPLRQKLVSHLQSLKLQGLISIWHDRAITPGTVWNDTIEKQLNEAQIILLLVSADFFSSNYIQTSELTRAMQKHERGDALVIPIILRPVYWQGAIFGKLQALPKDGLPVTSWPNHEDAFVNIAQGIHNAIEDLTYRQKAQQAKLAHESTDRTERVIVAIEKQNNNWRTLEGVSQETGIPLPEVQKIITELGSRIIKSYLPDIHGRALYTTRKHYEATHS